MQYFNRKSIVKTINASVELWTLQELKNYLKIDFSDDDVILDSMQKAARILAENYTGRAFINQTWKLTMDSFGGNVSDNVPVGYYEVPKEYFLNYGNYIEVPVKPLSSITSLITYSRNNTATTYSASNYTVDTASGRLYLNEGQVFPSNLRSRNAVELTFVAGYGSNPNDVPHDIRQAVLQLTASMYEAKGLCEMPCDCKALLDSYKILDSNFLC